MNFPCIKNPYELKAFSLICVLAQGSRGASPNGLTIRATRYRKAILLSVLYVSNQPFRLLHNGVV